MPKTCLRRMDYKMTEKLFYKEFGQGIPLTLLHSFPLDNTIWFDLVPDMEKACRLILPDLRGFGRSPAPKGPYSLKDMAEDVIGLLDTLEIEKTVLAGNSMGGYVALAAARYFPNRLSALALVASHAYADSPEKRESRLSSIPVIAEEGIFPTFTNMPEKLSYNKEVVKFSRDIISRANRDGVIGALSAMAERPDSIDMLTELAIPVLIIAGQKDQFISIETSRKMEKDIGKAELIEIPDAGHLPMLDNSTQTAAALLSLIKSL